MGKQKSEAEEEKWESFRVLGRKDQSSNSGLTRFITFSAKSGHASPLYRPNFTSQLSLSLLLSLVDFNCTASLHLDTTRRRKSKSKTQRWPEKVLLIFSVSLYHFLCFFMIRFMRDLKSDCRREEREGLRGGVG